MGLMDKFKNLFTDEEIIEEDDIEEPVKIKEIKKDDTTKEHKLPTFMREKIEKEEMKKKVEKSSEPKFEIKNEIELEPKKDINVIDSGLDEHEVNKFKFPVFDDSDFVEPTRVGRQAMRENKINVDDKEKIKRTVKKEINKKINTEPKVADLYKDKKKIKEQERKFRATPIISPIYGVLDKNYIPDEVATNKGDNYEISRHSKNVDFDSVRKKAYGSLSEDIKENLMCENCEYLKEAKACKKEQRVSRDNLMYESLCDNDDEKVDYKDVTLDEATENYFDYGVEYKKTLDKEPIIQNSDDEIKVVNNVIDGGDRKKREVPPVKSSINLLSTLKKSMGEENEVSTDADDNKEQNKDLELTDDLFSLIDSMYEERED